LRGLRRGDGSRRNFGWRPGELTPATVEY
jgi:hypothetical protein